MDSKNLLLLFLLFLLPFGASRANQDISPIYTLDDYVVKSSPLLLGNSEITQSWSILDDKVLESLKSDTVAQTIAFQPGLSQTFYGPNSNRPIIRGLDGYRIDILENGLSAFDLSKTSADHSVAIDPMLVERIEILRDSSALLHGCNSIGGVINVFDRTIPIKGNNSTFVNEFRSKYDSNNDGFYKGGILFKKINNFIFQIHGSSNKTKDYGIPKFALEEEHHEDDTEHHEDDTEHHEDDTDHHEESLVTKVNNSHNDFTNFGVGGSFTFDQGFIGASFSKYMSAYGVPSHEAPTIDLDRKKFAIKAAYNFSRGWFDSITFDSAFGDYSHKEISSAGEVHADFDYSGYENKFTLIKTNGKLDYAFGFNFNSYELIINGEESYLSGITGVNDPINKEDSKKFNFALMQKYSVSENIIFNGGLRFERLFRDYIGAPNRTDSCYNGSIGILFSEIIGTSIGGNFFYTQRIPETSELYSDGPHHATEGFEIGNSDLDNEKAIGAEIVFKNNSDKFNNTLSIYYNNFDNYIFLSETGQTVTSDEGEELSKRAYKGTKAYIYGIEYQFDYKLFETSNFLSVVKGFGDWIYGKNKTDDTFLPRFPPWRLGVGYYGQGDNVTLNLSVVHFGEQDNISPNETIGKSYTLLNSRFGYYLSKEKNPSELYLKINNITNELAFVHTSSLKDFAPLPGRSIEIGLNMKF